MTVDNPARFYDLWHMLHRIEKKTTWNQFWSFRLNHMILNHRKMDFTRDFAVQTTNNLSDLSQTVCCLSEQILTVTLTSQKVISFFLLIYLKLTSKMKCSRLAKKNSPNSNFSLTFNKHWPAYSTVSQWYCISQWPLLGKVHYQLKESMKRFPTQCDLWTSK